MKKLFIWLGVAVMAVLFCAVAGQAQALSWEQVNSDGFGDSAIGFTFAESVWGGYMYVGVGNIATGGSIWRSSGGTDWTKVTTDGLGDANNEYVQAFAVFRGDLFATLANSSTGTEIWRSRNGTDWVQVNSDGFGDNKNTGELSALQVFGDYLYATTDNDTTGVEIWRTANGTSWSQVNTDGFGSVKNQGSSALYVFEGQLYCGTVAKTGGGSEGARIFRTSDGTNWTSLISGGFGDTSRLWITSLIKFDDKLYAFVGPFPGLGTVQAWSSDDGSNWNQVTTVDFGNIANFNPSICPMAVNGTLYIGVANSTTGANLWRTNDGVTWSKELSNGAGDSGNAGLYSMTVWGDRMYIGYSKYSTGHSAELWRSEKIGVMDITTTSLSTAYEGKSYEQKLIVDNGTPGYQWTISAGRLPEGLSIDEHTGTISGTPKEDTNQTFTVTVTDYSTPTQTSSQEFTLKVINKGHIITAAGAGAAPQIRTFSAYGRQAVDLANPTAFANTFRGGVNVSAGDLDNDGLAEIVAAPRGNGAPQIRVFNEHGTLLTSFYAYDKNLRCGADVAVADMDGDGANEIVTVPGAGCGPQVKIFNLHGTAVLTKGFFAYSQGLRTGLRVAAGDVNQDGKAEIVTAPERGAQAQVRVFDYTGKAKGTTGFYPYGTQPTGADVAVADLSGDGKAEIITVPGEGYPAQVRVFNSAGQAKFTPGFYAYPQSVKTGFLISAGDLNSDGKAEIVTVPKTANAAQVRTFKYNGQAVFTPGFYAYSAAQKAGADVAVANF